MTPGRHYIAAVKEGGQLKLYVDGRLVALSAPFDTAKFDLAARSMLWSGVGRTASFGGELKDVRIYRRALTRDEINLLREKK